MGARPKVLNRVQTHATRKNNTEGLEGEMRRQFEATDATEKVGGEASELCETGENVTTKEKHHTCGEMFGGKRRRLRAAREYWLLLCKHTPLEVTTI